MSSGPEESLSECLTSARKSWENPKDCLLIHVVFCTHLPLYLRTLAMISPFSLIPVSHQQLWLCYQGNA